MVAAAAALLRAADPSASNGVIVGRLARNADAAGTAAQTGNGRLNLARAIADTSTDSVKPDGAAPVGDGGPLVGPYVAASNFADVTGTIRDSVTLLPIAGATVAVSCPGCNGTGRRRTQAAAQRRMRPASTPSAGWQYSGGRAGDVDGHRIGARLRDERREHGSTTCTQNGNCTPTRTINLTLTPTPEWTLGRRCELAEGTGAGTTTLTFTVTRANPSGTSTVAYTTAAGSATAGASCTGTTDYVTTSGTLTFAAGVTTQPVTVTDLP